MQILLLLLPLLFLAYLVYSNWANSADVNLQALAALQSKYVTLDSGKLDSKEFEKQKLEIIASINKNLDSTKQDVAELQTTIAVITSLSSDSNVFKKYMTQSTSGLADANVKIVNMAKDIASKVNKADLDQVRALLESKVSTTDISKLSSLIASIENKVNGVLSREEVDKIVKVKADQAALENVAASVKEISGKMTLLDSNNEITKISANIAGLSDLVKNNSESIEVVKTSMSTQLKELEKAISSLGDTDNKNLATATDQIATAMNQIATIRAGLDNKADVTVVSASLANKADAKTVTDLRTTVQTGLEGKANVSVVTDLQTNVKALLADVPGLKTSIEILTKSLNRDPQINYVPEEVMEFSTADTIRFAMIADSGVVSIGYTDNYTGTKSKSISLEQIKRILRDYDAVLGTSATVSFRSQKSIGINGRTWISFGSSESYITGLMNPESITSTDRGVQSAKFTPATINANTWVTKKLEKPNPGNPLIWPRFFSRLTMKTIYSIIQLSSRMDCIMEFVLDFNPRESVRTVKEKTSTVQIKAYKDNSTQPRIYFSGAVDASNGLNVPDPEYEIITKYGAVANSVKATCPANSYMCGLQDIGGLYPICCSFNTGMSYTDI